MNHESAGYCKAGHSLFRIESLPFADIPHQSSLFLDYQTDAPNLQKFYPSKVESHIQVAQNAEKLLKNYKTDRNSLCDVLVEINKSFGATEKTLENINLLRDADCVTVVTGQQAGLFSGAIYTIYKALSAVKLAECLSTKGRKAVPVFWIAEEDHDFDEVKKTFALDRQGKLAEFENTPQNYSENLPVGEVYLEETIEPTIDELFEKLPLTEFSDEIKKTLKNSYNAKENYSSAFAALLTKIFDKYGLIIFSPLNAGLKKLAAPIFTEAVKKSDEIRESLLARNDELKTENYPAQVLVEADFFPFFLIDENGKRRALKKNKNGKIQAKETNREFTLGELTEIAERSPEKLSPNALMRPVVQDYLLPTICYFGGGAEIAYFAQNSVLYEILQRPATPILHRQSFTIVESKHQRTLKSYGLRLTELFGGIEGVLPQIVEKYLNKRTAKIFTEAEESINAQLNLLEQDLQQFDSTLAENLANRRRKIFYHIGALRTKFHHAQLLKDETIHRRIENLFAALLPHNALQERTLNITTFLNSYGFNFIDWIYEAIDLNDKAHRVIYL